MKYLSLTLPGSTSPVQAPPGIHTGGLSTDGQTLIQIAFNYLTIIGVLAAIIFILYSGIQWAMSGGDKTALENARKRLTYSIIGLVVILCAFAIVRIAISLIGGSPDYFLQFAPRPVPS